MKTTSLALIALLLASQAPAAPSSGGGGIGGGTAPQIERSPEQLARDYYKRGVRHREKAWRLEEKAAAASSETKRDKALAQAQKQYLGAIDDLKQSLSYELNNHEAANELGYALRKTGDYTNALGAYNHALKLKPDYHPAIEYRAEAFLALGELERAKDGYLQLFREAPDLAARLLEVMQDWANAHPPASETEQAFAQWVRERTELAGITGEVSAAGGSW